MIPLLAAILASPISTGFTPATTESAPAPELAIVSEPAPPGFDLSVNSFAAPAADEIKPEDLDVWHGSVSLGATIATGNTERTTFAASGKAENRREKDRRSAELLWNYTEEDDSVTERRIFALGKYDYFVNEKRYWFGQLSGEYNKAAFLDLRVIIAGGLGHQFREDEKLKFGGEVGLAYVDEDYEVNADDGEYIAARLAYKADWNPDEKWNLGQTTELFPSLEDSDDISARVDTHAKLALSEKMFAQVQWLYTWDNTPATGAERVDNLFLLMLGWSF